MKKILVHAIALVALINGIHGQTAPGDGKQICTPGARTQVDCNTCTCSKDGTALGCTRMACPKIPAEFLNPDGSLKLPHQSNPLLRTKRDQICEPGTTRQWDCNNCLCNLDGTGEVCTRRICPRPSRERRDVSLKCTPNESFMDDCNHCRCSSNGRSAACTLMACVPIFNADGSLKHPHQSNPLLRTKRDQVCRPNTSRIWECNNCICSPDGTKEVCTRRVCPAVPRNRRDAPFRCTPNKSFKQDCNTCFCSPDGRSAGCTLMACLPQTVYEGTSPPKIAP